MKRVFALLIPLAAVWLFPAATDAANAKPRQINKIAVLALAKDAARCAGVEADLGKNFVERAASADSLRSLFQNTTPVPQMIAQLRSSGYDTLLCMYPRKTIRITTPESTSKESKMETCLTSYATGTSPSGDPLDVNPFVEENAATPEPVQGSLRSPIPSKPQAAPFRLIKGTLRLYDVSSGRQVWHKSVQVKVPAEMRDSLQNKLIVHEVWQAISDSGLLPPKN